jgi:hypothetical protein
VATTSELALGIGRNYDSLFGSLSAITKSSLISRGGAAFLGIDLSNYQSLINALEAGPQQRRESFEALGKAGWYSDPEWDCIASDTFAAAIKENRLNEVDTELTADFDERASEIQDRLCVKFPSRASILAKAFTAHINGAYELSVPVFLIQAEGIWFDATGKQFFGKGGDGNPKPAEFVNQLSLCAVEQSVFHAAITPMPISATAKERANMPGVFNRHAILHGEASDYATKINSCKAISLLCYLSWLTEILRSPVAIRDA